MPPFTKTTTHPVVGRVSWRADDDRSGAPVHFLDNFAEQIEDVFIPQLVSVVDRRSEPFREFDGHLLFYRGAAGQLRAAWAEVERAGLLPLVVSFIGSYAPRLIRRKDGGPTKSISNHAFGTAFDINNEYNPQGTIPPAIGAPGSVRQLVPIFEKFGFNWGGHFPTPDGMHFEVAKLITIGYRTGATAIDIFQDATLTHIPALLIDDHVWMQAIAAVSFYGGVITKAGGNPFTLALSYREKEHVLNGRIIDNRGFVKLIDLAPVYNWTYNYISEQRKVVLR